MRVFTQLMMKRFHSAKNYIDLSVVGSLTINNGIVGGFGNSNYLESTEAFTLGSSFEFYIEFTTGTLSNVNQIILANKDASKRYINIGYTKENGIGTLIYNIGNGSSWITTVSSAYGSSALQSNTKYYLKFYYTGIRFVAEISTDGTNWIQDWSYTISNTFPTLNLLFGVSRIPDSPWQGLIDIGSSYIKIAEIKYKLKISQ